MPLPDHEDVNEQTVDRLALFTSWLRAHMDHLKCPKLTKRLISRVGLSINELDNHEVAAFMYDSDEANRQVMPRMNNEEMLRLAERMSHEIKGQDK